METITETKQERTRCEVYSRVVGYLRPVDQWNEGKQAEFAERQEYVVKTAATKTCEDGCNAEANPITADTRTDLLD